MRPESESGGGNGGTSSHPVVLEFLATLDRIRAETDRCDGYDFDAHVASMRGLRLRIEAVVARRQRRGRSRMLEAEQGAANPVR